MDKKILVIDSTTPRLEISFFDGENISKVVLNYPKTHSETILNSINYILRAGSFNVKDVDLFGVITGPGSFTGIRIGISTVKSLSYANGTNPLGMDGLRLMALKNSGVGYRYVGVLFDARRGEVYFKLFKKNGNELIGISEYLSIPIEDIKSLIEDVDNTLLIISGNSDFFENIKGKLSKFNVVFKERTNLTDILIAEILKRLKENRLKEIEVTDGFYIRPSDAMKKLSDKNRKNKSK